MFPQNNSSLPLLKLILVGAATLVLLPSSALAAEIQGAVSLTFDDANKSQFDFVGPVMEEFDQNGVLYVPTGSVGDTEYVSWEDLNTLENAGWEIAGHTVTHAELPELSRWEMRKEVNQCFTDLEKNGLNPENFATPFGAYDPTTMATIAQSFNSHRGFHEVGYNKWPYNKYYLHVQQITNQTTLAEVENWIEEAMAGDHWLVLVFHEVLPVVDPTDAYSWSTQDFRSLLELLDEKNIKTKTIKEVLASENFLVNGSFEEGFGTPGQSNYWKSSGSAVRVDSFNRGSFPSPRRSARFSGTPRSGYLFGPAMAVSSDTTYGFRFFANTISLRSGELGYYIDEYDTNGNWISGKWLGQANMNFVLDESYQYTPSSANVTSASIQIYLTAGARGNAYVDGVEFFTP